MARAGLLLVNLGTPDSTGVADVRRYLGEASSRLGATGQRTLLFVDEIHRFNKAQQDALLPHVESGLLTLVGGTTEHPGLAVNSALLSRAQVYTLEPLSGDELNQLYERALPHLQGVTLDADALDLLKGFADGDGRRFLNLLEQVTNAASGAGKAVVDGEFAKLSTSPSLRRFDKGGDEFYWQLSAFHKSLRGSDPDAALYWLARILDGSGDVSQVTRRMIVVASEDIGNADPRALQSALDAWAAYERLGSPEGELALAQAVVYLACAAKSNAVYRALQAAQTDVVKLGTLEVPLHLRNAPTRLMKSLGHGQDYRYAHNESDAFAAGENYFPEKLQGRRYYEPVDRGLEIKIAERLARLRQANTKARGESSSDQEPD